VALLLFKPYLGINLFFEPDYSDCSGTAGDHSRCLAQFFPMASTALLPKKLSHPWGKTQIKTVV